MSRFTRSALILAFAGALAIPVAARAPITIKLATITPVNSSWHKALLDMGNEWNTKTAGRVKLTVYAGGTQGDEAAVIRLMRPGVDQLHASLLMAPGLAQIDPAFDVFGMPFFFQDDAEASAVVKKLAPTLETKVNAKGFHILGWGSAGWVQLFSKKPLKTLEDVKAAKMYTSQGDEKSVQWYKSNGFHPVALNANDIPAQLKLPNGMIDTAPMPPYPVLMLQVFRDAKYMLDVRVAPLLGALVISNNAWNKIDAADQKIVADAAQAFEKRVMVDAPKQDADSVATMKTRGLLVQALDPKAATEFRAAADKLVPAMRGALVPADMFDAATRERDAFRKTRK